MTITAACETLWTLLDLYCTLWHNSNDRQSICHKVATDFTVCCLIASMLSLVFLKAHWGRVTHICINGLTIIGSDNGLSPGRRQAIIWSNDGILLIRPLGTNFNEILIEIDIISFKKIRLKMSSGKWRPFCLGLNVLITIILCLPTVNLYLHRQPEGIPTRSFKFF